MFNTPILLITFNRPDHARRVLSEIRKQQPSELYICQDGPREGNTDDLAKVQEVRNVVNELVDWPCNLHTLYQEKNLGCGPGPVAGISWFFDNVEMGIILEDDCIPNSDFFLYCAELLERYKKDERIGFIGGCNYQDGQKRGDGSYYFSMGHHGTWGWACWRRVWIEYDYALGSISQRDFSLMIRHYGRGHRFVTYWEEIFDRVKNDRMNDSAWDYQFYFTCWKNFQLAVMPNVNLVSNIGDGSDATHTSGISSLLYQNTVGILPLIHPSKKQQDRKADMYFHKSYIQPYNYGWSGIKRLPHYFNKKLKKLVGYKGSWIKKK